MEVDTFMEAYDRKMAEVGPQGAAHHSLWGRRCHGCGVAPEGAGEAADLVTVHSLDAPFPAESRSPALVASTLLGAEWQQGPLGAPVLPNRLPRLQAGARRHRRVMSLQEEAKAEEEEGVPDDEGWVKVTRRGRRPVLPRTEAASLRVLEREKRKRARKELLNFYAWQHRETKMERKGAPPAPLALSPSCLGQA